MTLRAYKYRIYPTPDQEFYLNQVFGSVRFVWNALVANFNSWSPDGPNRPMSEKILKDMDENSWLHESMSQALQQKRIDFDSYKTQFFNKKRKTKVGRAKFKKRGISNDSFRLPGAKIDLDSGFIKLPKMPPIRMVVDREFHGESRSVTISRNKVNQYFASILVREEIRVKPVTGKSIGIDLGLTHFATLSDGTKVDNPRIFRESQTELARAQRHLARKTKGSNRYNRQKVKVAKIHLKIANRRKDFLHKLSIQIVSDFDSIFMEDLNIAGMVKNRSLAKSVSDAGWADFVGMISYKSSWYGRSFHKIDRFYPSSKTCSGCGFKAQKMDLSVRTWECPGCGEIHDRDINAAKNIFRRGLEEFHGI